MAASGLIGAKDKRDMMEAGSPKLAEAGLSFLREGRWGEALECLAQAGHDEGLAQLAQEAVQCGDLFFYRQALKALGKSPDPEQLKQLADRAQAAGLSVFAQAALKNGE